MRIPTFILSLVLTLIMFLQACAVTGLGSMADSLAAEESPSSITSAGATGVWAALFCLIGMAFVLAKPGVSVVCFLLGALVALGAGSMGFSDMSVYAVALFILAVMSYYTRKQQIEKRAEYTTFPPGYHGPEWIRSEHDKRR